MQYLDARGSDGKTRKFRVMMIDGQLYLLHCAISSHWKIHYFTAEMADNPAHRAEDQAFLEDMRSALGPIAMDALARIQSALYLDYTGIDFGLNAKGEILFDANATMVVNPPEPDARWNYRRPAYERIAAAIRKMLTERASSERSVAEAPPRHYRVSEVTLLEPKYCNTPPQEQTRTSPAVFLYAWVRSTRTPPMALAAQYFASKQVEQPTMLARVRI